MDNPLRVGFLLCSAAVVALVLSQQPLISIPAPLWRADFPRTCLSQVWYAWTSGALARLWEHCKKVPIADSQFKDFST